ncbi:MAG: YgiQ family radical SAM protein, partial [Candidatus Omnitrophica bacterium]|nr:YgiQ family radical SAM protein [Candidatus Omnitrophota bacterium]
MPDTNRDIFLPTTHSEMEGRGWDELDVILITGDAYVDHPSYGAAVIGRVLEDAGFRTGIIAQPDWKKTADFKKLGRPKLFFGITAGNLDSALSNYTPARKIRHKDYYSPGGRSGLRPNLATVVYANKVREAWPGAPVVIGGIEASLRRLAHYSYWDDSVRRSILLDAKADILVYGMGERQTVEIAKRIRDGEDIKHLDGIPGTVVARSAHLQIPKSVTLPSYEEVRKDPVKFNEAFKLSYYECDAVRGRPVVQPHADRSIIQYPPPLPLKTAEIDHLYDLPFTRRWHPCYDVEGGVPGFEVVRFSITSHRGCSAECNFCSLYAHQGRIIQSRSHDSILREVKRIAALAEFKGTITDIGGPTANL